jgi:hypothetical protein
MYKNKLADIVVNGSFTNLVADEWKDLVPLINQDVLDAAHQSAEQYRKVFNISMCQSRPVKTMKRITIKASATRPDVPFKVNSDLVGFRFPLNDIKDIKRVMNTLRERVTAEEGGVFFIRNSIEDDTGVLTDIIQYAFAYIPQLGYVVEIQVGHPFAMYTFSVDSLIRDKRLLGESTEDIVDLWDDDFYSFVKELVLKHSHSITMSDVLAKWPGKDGQVPDQELTDILVDVVARCV